MGMDIDYIAAKQQLEEIKRILDCLPHGKREDISNKIECFYKEIKDKYGDLADKV